MKLSLRLTLVVLLAATGCDGEPEEVGGTMVDTSISESGDVPWPWPADELTLTALVPQTDGTFLPYPGSVASDGSFRIPGVPEGVFYLKWQWSHEGSWPIFVVGDSRRFDLGVLQLGRSDFEFAHEPTALDIRASGMTPWTKGDALQFFSLGAMAYEGNLEDVADAPIPEGATELGPFRVDVSQFQSERLVDGGRGDRAIISQQVARKSEGVWYWASDRSFTAEPFTQSSGEPVAINGAFQELRPQKAKPTWDQLAFADLAAQVHPAAIALDQYLMFQADPAGAGRRSLWDRPHFLLAHSPAPEDGSADLSMDLIYGNPFPSRWTPVVEAVTSFHFPHLPEGFTAGISTVAPLDEALKAPLAPAITPARRLRVSGLDATESLAGTGLTPTIEWEPPARGKASSYYLFLYQQDAAGELQMAGAIATALTRVTVPPSVLQPDAPYLVILSALTGRPANAPYQAKGTHVAYAETVSGLLAP